VELLAKSVLAGSSGGMTHGEHETEHEERQND
jgi:hypothetical protein